MSGPPSTRPDTVFLVDLSGYIYRAYHAIQPLNTADGTPTNAVYGVTRMLVKLLNQVPQATVIAAQDSPGPSWRHQIFPDYKANRPPIPEDLKIQIPWVHKIVEALGIPTVRLDGHEADDLIAGLAKHFAALGRPVVIVSSDKDLMQLIGEGIWMWDPMRDTVYDAEAVRHKWGVGPEAVADLLALMGDSSDNVPGVAGIGAKRAGALIAEYGNIATLLDKLDELPKQAWANNLRADPERARLSYRLVYLPGVVPDEIDPATLLRRDPDVAALRAYFQHLEFYSLLQEVGNLVPLAADAPATRADGSDHFMRERRIEVLTDIAEIIRRLDADLLSFDTETSDLEPHRTTIVGLSFSDDGKRAWYVPVGHLRAQNVDWNAIAPALAAWAADPTKAKWGQNLKYDTQVLLRAGITLTGIRGDAMLASYLVSPDERGHSLDALAARELGHTTIKYSDVAGLGGFAAVPVNEAAAYAGEDALVAYALCARLHERLREHDLLHIYQTLELDLVPVLAAMEWHGIRLDTEALAAVRTDLMQQLAQLEKDIAAHVGHGINLSSPKQVGELLFEQLGVPTKGVRRTKTGTYSTDAETLERLRDQHPVIGLILEHRGLTKLLSTYVDALPAAVLKETGRIHPKFHQTVAATGRLSCSDPNLQNIPIRDDWGRRIRRCFVAAPGHTFVGADYSQIELRILAHVSNDPGLIAAFREGADVHTRTAAEVFDTTPEAVTPEQRRAAKAINFGLMYGMGAQRLARSLGISPSEAKAYIDRYFERYPGVRAFREAAIAAAREHGYSTTLMGRRRWIPEFASNDPRLIAQAERIAVNSPIQGSAADIIKLAMIRIHRRLGAEFPGARLILQVHDELLVEAPEADAAAVEALVAAEMRGAADLKVPLTVESGCGPTWLDAHG